VGALPKHSHILLDGWTENLCKNKNTAEIVSYVPNMSTNLLLYSISKAYEVCARLLKRVEPANWNLLNCVMLLEKQAQGSRLKDKGNLYGESCPDMQATGWSGDAHDH
jgi:hypothetical protein